MGVPFGLVKTLQKRVTECGVDADFKACKAALAENDNDEERSAAALGATAAPANAAPADAGTVPSGVTVETTMPGDGSTFPKEGDLLTIHYKGTLHADGTEFDSSYSRGKPFEFIIGAGNVIEGWDVGLMQCSQGEKATLTISPDLAYGAAGHGPVPANAALVFEVWLQKIESRERAPGARPKRADYQEAAKMLMGDVQHRM